MNHKAPMVRLGELITQRHEKYIMGEYPIRGVTRDGFIPPKQKDADLSLYNVFYKNDFVFNPARMEINSIALNTEFAKAICSSLYEVFFINDTEKLLPEYLNLFLKRDEFSRYCEFDAIGSARNYFRISNMQNILVPLPSLEVQRSLVAIYDGLQKIISENEILIQKLESVCHDFVIDCKYKYQKVRVGEMIEVHEIQNINGNDYPFMGVNRNKRFMPTVANTNELDRTKYKVVSHSMFVFSGMQTGRDICIRLALQTDNDSLLISPAYTTFVIKDLTQMLPEFFYLLFCRSEMDRYGAFLSDGSIRSNLDWDRFCEIEVPLPPIEIQRSIVTVIHCLLESDRIVQKAREIMKTICPALVQKAAHSA